MVGNMYFFAICALVASIEAKTISFASSYPYIFKLELKFNEEKINDFIIDSFFATNNGDSNKLLHCDINLNDIVKAIPYKKLAISDISTAVNKLNLDLTDDDIGNFISNLDYSELSAMGFSMQKLHKNIAKTYFKGRPTALLDCLNILGIGEQFSMSYAFGTDEDLFKAFQNASFSKDNIVQIQNIINTPSTLKDILNIVGVKKFNEIYLANFINNRVTPLLFEKGLTEENFKQFLKSLNVSVGNYKNSKTFKTCYNTITKGNSIAVAISDNEMITNDDSAVLKYLNLEQYVTLVARSVESEDISYTILADNIDGNTTDNIIRIKTNAILPSYIEETSTYSDISNKFCQYVTILDDDLEIQDTAANVVNDQLVISKLYNTHFKKGSPLICGQKLYGLASLDKTSALVFDTVEESFSDEVSSLPDHYKPEIINIIKEFFEDLKANFDPCKYNLCNNEEQKDIPSNEDESNVNTEENLEANEENKNTDEDDAANNDNTETTDGNNVIDNTDENINQEQNEEENDNAQSENVNTETENSTDDGQNDQSIVSDDQTLQDNENDILNNSQTDSENPEINSENQNNEQGDASPSQEVSDVSDSPSPSSQETEAQTDSSDVGQEEQEIDNQTNISDTNDEPQEADSNQNVQDVNQAPQDGDLDETNVTILSEESQDEGVDELGSDNNIENDANEQEINNNNVEESINASDSNQGILEGRTV